MKSKKEVLQALKQFAKEVGAPDALICDASGEQTSSELKKFCNDMGTSLRILETKIRLPYLNLGEECRPKSNTRYCEFDRKFIIQNLIMIPAFSDYLQAIRSKHIS